MWYWFVSVVFLRDLNIQFTNLSFFPSEFNRSELLKNVTYYFIGFDSQLSQWTLLHLQLKLDSNFQKFMTIAPSCGLNVDI